MALAIGTATFTAGGAETANFTWVDTITGAPVTLASSTPQILNVSQTITTAGQGPGTPFFATAPTGTGGTVTMANPPNCTVTILGSG